MTRYEYDYGDCHAEYSELTGRVLVFYGDGTRDVLGGARSHEEALQMVADWFGGVAPRRIRETYISLHVFPFP